MDTYGHRNRYAHLAAQIEARRPVVGAAVAGATRSSAGSWLAGMHAARQAVLHRNDIIAVVILLLLSNCGIKEIIEMNGISVVDYIKKEFQL